MGLPPPKVEKRYYEKTSKTQYFGYIFLLDIPTIPNTLISLFVFKSKKGKTQAGKKVEDPTEKYRNASFLGIQTEWYDRARKHLHTISII